MSDKIAITLTTLEKHNHIVGDIERGIKLYNRGGIDFTKDARLGYVADVPEKGEHRRVMLNFTDNGRDLESFFCNKCALRNSGAVCRHVVAGILAVQGGVPEEATLETERLVLRPLSLKDFDAVHSWGSNPENVRYMAWGPNDEAQTRAFLSSAQTGRDFAVTLKESAVVIGSCGIYPDSDNDTGDVGWILHKDHWKQGYGTELASELIRYGFEDLKLRRITAPCAAVNYGSYRVMERNDMRREALHRKAFWARIDKEWVDEAIYAILAEDYFSKRSGVSYDVSEINEKTRQLATDFLCDYWAGSFIMIRGERIDMTAVDGFTIIENGTLIGVVTYIVRDDACEIVSLNSISEKRGVGTALVNAVAAIARKQGCVRLQLLTTNDNLNAIGFYQKRGFELVGINLGAIDREREQKPSIPLIGQNGIPIRHEVEFAMQLQEDQ